jgi:hypothetical protein
MGKRPDILLVLSQRILYKRQGVKTYQTPNMSGILKVRREEFIAGTLDKV